ncbi:glycerophosphodiester phosphodiesterase family protein [soil metagenome]
MLPLIIGHRGASAVAPENTLAAFAHALDDGADGIEFDVRLARDGVPIVIHDATLKRTALQDGAVAALNSSELSEIDVGSWFNRRFPARARDEYARECVPTLRQVLSEIAPRCRTLYVELKCAPREACALAAATVKVIRECATASRSIVESFELSAIREVKQLTPEIRTAALFERRLTKPLPHPGKIVARALAVGADELALQRTLISRRIVRAAVDAGLPVVVWTVDHPSWIERARQLGLHALITNHPAYLCAALVK